MTLTRVVMLGHKDHGKSSLIGRMLISSGKVTPERVEEAKRASTEVGTEFEPAFLLDTFSDEREMGMTFDNTRVQLPYRDLVFELIDVPGHEELMRSMLSGSSSADFAVVVISSKEDEGITDQTKRHIYVAKLFGIEHFVVAINKMDVSGFDERVYTALSEQISSYLVNIGVSENNFTIIPVSARKDTNILTSDERINWFRGRSLFEELYATSTEARNRQIGNLEQRVIIQSSILRNGLTAVLGKVISGEIRKDADMTVIPGWKPLKVLEILSGMEKVESSGLGESIALITSTPLDKTSRGSVITTKQYSGYVSNHIKAHVFFLESASVNLSLLLMDVPSKIYEMKTEEIINPGDGTRIRGGTPVPLESAIVSIKVEGEIAFDSFQRCREMGAIVILSNGKLIASGTIISD